MEYFGTNFRDYGHYIFNIDGQYMLKIGIRIDELPFNPEQLTNELSNGSVVYYQGGGYTVIGIAGSCKDERPGTKSVFWVNELLERNKMIGLILEHHLASKIIEALPFVVQWYEGT